MRATWESVRAVPMEATTLAEPWAWALMTSV